MKVGERITLECVEINKETTIHDCKKCDLRSLCNGEDGNKFECRPWNRKDGKNVIFKEVKEGTEPFARLENRSGITTDVDS